MEIECSEYDRHASTHDAEDLVKAKYEIMKLVSKLFRIYRIPSSPKSYVHTFNVLKRNR